MKRWIFAGILFLLFTSLVNAQPSLCTITGTIYKPTGATCNACTFKITKSKKGGVVLSTIPVTVTADGSGAVSFTVVQGSIITLQGDVWLGTYTLAAGKDLYVPVQSSATLSALKSVEDALDGLISPSVFAPADEPFITKTPSSNLTGEFALSSLTTGILKNTTTTGIPTIAVGGTDYEFPLTFAARLARSANTIDLANSGVTPGSCTACDLTIDTYGRVTAKANGSGGGGTVSSVFGRTGAVVAAQDDYTFAQLASKPTTLAGYGITDAQPLDADLTAIAGLSPTNDDIVQRKAGAWTNRTPAQFKIDLGLVKADVGLGNVENTALSTWAGSTNLTTLGTITTGVWNGTAIANANLANSAITIQGSAVALGGTALATNSNPQFGNLGLNVASPTNGGQIATTLGANNITGLLIKRFTDTAPTGKYFDFQNAAGTSVASMDVAGNLTVAGCTGCGGASFANPTASVGLTAVNGAASTAMRSDAAPALDQGIVPTWTGAHTFASTIALSSTTASLNKITQGAAIAIGTTSTDGIILRNTTAAAAGAQQYSPRLHFIGQGWKTNATAASQTVDWIVENQPVQGAANPTTNLVISSQVNGGGYTSSLVVGSNGLISGGTTSSQSGWRMNGATLLAIGGDNSTAARVESGSSFYISGKNIADTTGYRLVSAGLLTWTSSTNDPTATADITLRRAAAANLAFGAADAAAPVAQIQSVQNVVGGTSNTLGANWTFNASRGTGTGAGGSIIFQTAPAGGSGTTQNTLAAAFTVNGDGSVSIKSVTFANLPTQADAKLIYCSDCTLASPCASGGTGAFAKGINGAWVCN